MNCVIENIKHFNSLLGLLVNFDENVKFQCNKDGLTTQCLANANTSILKVTIDKAYFSEYTCEKNHMIGINVKLLNSILKKTSKHDKLALKTKEDVLSLSISNDFDSNLTTYDVKLVEFEQDLLDIPDLDYHFSCVISSAKLKSWKNLFDITGDNIEFAPQEENVLRITADTGGHTMQRLEKLNFNIFENPKPFRLSGQSMLIVCSMTQFDQDICMCYQNDTPIEFSIEMDNLKIESWFAPMMEMDED